jgi:hypothetical protein
MKKKKFNFDQRKFDLFTGGKPCTPGDLRNLSKEDVEDWFNHLGELIKKGKAQGERTYSLTEHEYYDRLINENIEIENYEECARLLKLKNETPYSEERTRFISETL